LKIKDERMANIFTSLAPILFSAAQQVSEEATGALQSAQVRASSALGRDSEVPESPQAGHWKTVSTKPAASRVWVTSAMPFNLAPNRAVYPHQAAS